MIIRITFLGPALPSDPNRTFLLADCLSKHQRPTQLSCIDSDLDQRENALKSNMRFVALYRSTTCRRGKFLLPHTVTTIKLPPEPPTSNHFYFHIYLLFNNGLFFTSYPFKLSFFLSFLIFLSIHSFFSVIILSSYDVFFLSLSSIASIFPPFFYPFFSISFNFFSIFTFRFVSFFLIFCLFILFLSFFLSSCFLLFFFLSPHFFLTLFRFLFISLIVHLFLLSFYLP